MWWLLLILLQVVQPTGPSHGRLALGQANRGVFVWIGGHTLTGPFRFVADTTAKQIYIIDVRGQSYPLIIPSPLPPPPPVVDASAPGRLAPGLLDTMARKRRVAITNRLYQVRDSLSRVKADPVVTQHQLELVTQCYPNEIDLDRSHVTATSARLYWRGWSIPYPIDLRPPLPPRPVSQVLREYVYGLKTTLNGGWMVILGYDGLTSIAPSDQIAVYQAEIDQLRSDQIVSSLLLTFPAVTDPIKQHRTVQQWLDTAKER